MTGGSSFRQLAGHGMQCPLDSFGVARDDSEVGFSRLVGLRAALFPIPQSAKRDVVARGKFLLGQRQGAAEGLDARYGTQLACLRLGQWWVFMVAGGVTLVLRPAPQRNATPSGSGNKCASFRGRCPRLLSFALPGHEKDALRSYPAVPVSEITDGGLPLCTLRMTGLDGSGAQAASSVFAGRSRRRRFGVRLGGERCRPAHFCGLSRSQGKPRLGAALSSKKV